MRRSNLAKKWMLSVLFLRERSQSCIPCIQRLSSFAIADLDSAHLAGEDNAACRRHLEDMAIRVGKAHSAFMDSFFRYAFWTLLIVVLIGLAVAILVW